MNSFLLGCLILISLESKSQTTVYCIPGQGADYRVFNNIDLGPEYSLKYIHHIDLEKGEDMGSYSFRMADQIDTTEDFVLIGTSLGGMIATEMNEFLNPEKTIIIASAKTKNELPKRYTFQQRFPLYKVVPKRMIKVGAFALQPIVEPDSWKDRHLYRSMMKNKDSEFLKRSTEMILTWERTTYDNEIIHFHGTDDHTIPFKNVNANFIIDEGSHMMTLTRGEELSESIIELLN